MYKRLLVPLDGSENAEKILSHVKIIALSCHVPEVIILNIIEPDIYDQSLLYMNGSVMNDIREVARTVAQKYVEKICGELKKEGINAIGVIDIGKAADIILDYAGKNNIDLIMLCTHGRSGVSRWVFGSVAERIIHHTTIPVFLMSLRKAKD